MPRRVVVTGVGIISPLGHTAEEHFEGLLAGRCGISTITAFEVGDFPVKCAGEVKDFKGNKYLKNRKALKMMARDIQLAVAAASLAARDAGVYESSPDATRMGVSMGAGLIPTELDELAAGVAASADEGGRFDLRKFGREGLSNLFPLWLLKYLPNMLNSHIAIECDAQGPNNCITAGGASGVLAIGEAARVIERDAADIMIAGAAETKVHPLSLARLYLAGRLSEASDICEVGTRPFGVGREGMAAGEGGAVLVLEEAEHARARGAKIYAEVVGFGTSCGGQILDEVSADGRGAVEAMRSALSDAGVEGRDVAAVFANASGLKEDVLEARAIAAAAGEGTRVTSTRGTTGHMGAAAGASDAATAALAVSRKVICGTLGAGEIEQLSVEVARENFEAEGAVVVVNAFSSGGQTSSLVLKAY